MTPCLLPAARGMCDDWVRPWNVLLLALLFGRAPHAQSTLRSQPSKVRECSNRANPLSVAIVPFQSLRILPRPDAIDRRDPSKSREVYDLGMRMHDGDTPSPSFDNLRTDVTSRANNRRRAAFLTKLPTLACCLKFCLSPLRKIGTTTALTIDAGSL
jgi:hypothetical protein